MDNQLLRYGAKDYFFRATLCRMCQDTQDATNSLAKYEDMFPVFSDSRECKLVKVTDQFVFTMWISAPNWHAFSEQEENTNRLGLSLVYYGSYGSKLELNE